MRKLFCLFAAFLTTLSFLAAEPPAHCHCNNCKCTSEKQCGCYSASGCQCTTREGECAANQQLDTKQEAPSKEVKR